MRKKRLTQLLNLPCSHLIRTFESHSIQTKSLSDGEKFSRCIEIGDLILDLSTKRKIRGIEIMNASDYLQGFFKLAGADKKILENLVKAKFRATAKGNSLMLVLALIAMVRERKEEIPATIAVPMSKPLLCH